MLGRHVADQLDKDPGRMIINLGAWKMKQWENQSTQEKQMSIRRL